MEQSEFEHIAKDIRQTALATALATHADADEAEDVAQDVMLKLWTLRADITGKSHAAKLASCMTHNLTIDKHRRRHTVALDTSRTMIDDKMTNPAAYTENRENMTWLEKRLSELPATEYQILRLRQVERKTNDEIAAILGIEKSSVSTLLSKVRKKMLNEIRNRTLQ